MWLFFGDILEKLSLWKGHIIHWKVLLNHKNRPTRLKCYYFAEWDYSSSWFMVWKHKQCLSSCEVAVWMCMWWRIQQMIVQKPPAAFTSQCFWHFFLCTVLEWLSAQSWKENIALEKLPISLPLSCVAEDSAVSCSLVWASHLLAWITGRTSEDYQQNCKLESPEAGSRVQVLFFFWCVGLPKADMEHTQV